MAAYSESPFIAAYLFFHDPFQCAFLNIHTLHIYIYAVDIIILFPILT